MAGTIGVGPAVFHCEDRQLTLCRARFRPGLGVGLDIERIRRRRASASEKIMEFSFLPLSLLVLSIR